MIYERAAPIARPPRNHDANLYAISITRFHHAPPHAAMPSTMPRTPIRYAIRPLDPRAHRYEAVCRVEHPDPAGQRLALPAWIPGSYLIRDFARHIVAIRAESGGRPVRLTKRDKHTWQAAPLRDGQTLDVICESSNGNRGI